MLLLFVVIVLRKRLTPMFVPFVGCCSIGYRLFVQIGHKGLQTFFDDFLVVQGATEYEIFELFVDHPVTIVQLGIGVSAAATI